MTHEVWHVLAQKFCVLKEDLTVKRTTHFCEIYLNNFIVDYHDKINIDQTNGEKSWILAKDLSNFFLVYLLYFVKLLCLKLRKLQRKPNFDYKANGKDCFIF